MNYIYIRVSTEKQDYLRQIGTLNEKGYQLYDATPTPSTGKGTPTPPVVIKSERSDVKVYCEKYTGTKLHSRKQLMELLDNLEEGDNLIIDSFSRLARSMKDLMTIIDMVGEKGAGFISLKEQLDLSTATGKLMFNIIGSINQFERDITSERTKETLRIKKEEGMILGRPIEHDHQAIIEYAMSVEQPSFRQIAKTFDVSLGNVSNILKNNNIDPRTREFLEN